MNKYFKHLLALAIVFGLFSCSKDTIEDKEDLVFKEKKLRLEITPHFEQEHIFDFLEVLLDVRSEEDVDVITNINVEKEKTRYSKDNHQFVLRSEEHTSELQSRFDLVCRLLLEQKKRAHARKT